MKFIINMLIMTGLATMIANAASKDDLKDQKKRFGYGLGANYARNLKQNNLDVDLDMFLQGMKDFLSGESLMSDQEIQSTTKEVGDVVRAQRNAEQEKVAKENAAEGESFLEANKTKEGVKTLGSGMQYKVVQTGEGPIPTASDKVRVHYKGTFIDGKEFDSSYKRNQPATFNVTGVIKGWTEALQLMKVGSKWQLFIPSDLAYGKGGNRSIPPNSTLLFEVELLGIEETPKPKKAAPITSDIIKVPSAEELKNGAKIEVIKKDKVDEYIKKNNDSPTSKNEK
ncbi:FKBP-type peptidyl-prolyl cis-trans isomerase [Verrucomicrobia bacterium]|jgi:FKBP-type peptidyl-prolyl cis-trans isomerase FklB|nr:FKBP-type peptidyl-prolyl cis-trans isomerase [bacterium]MDB4350600.1 FKBP-type peptidyl-prolyl cis-trans isomerase [Verrucomicrobiota bacterium]MDB4663180.1 FKBP-type peptidyl-prolyl cis-trans isomerase [bacterium]MDB4803871.1 FKBP-type peptidyl-prolyl cis-trans isomerase [Verrucomicrobiota bacterium]MDC0266360.1 FKBP-type peptidyl-prolyl cis-trans isomerase [bacterium]